MLRFAANLTMLFSELPFVDRFGAARDAGFRAVEFSCPPSVAAKDIAKYLRMHDLRQVLATVPLRPGSKGFAAMPRQQSAFRDDFQRGLEYATEAGCPLLHSMSGTVEPQLYQEASKYFDENMRWAMEEAESCGVKIVIEAINQTDVPGYFIRSLDDAHQWTHHLDGLGLILDLYHASMESGKPCSPIELARVKFDHVQIASFPSRNEPDQNVLSALGELDLLRAQQFTGWVGCEYVPARNTLAGLGWLSPYLT